MAVPYSHPGGFCFISPRGLPSLASPGPQILGGGGGEGLFTHLNAKLLLGLPNTHVMYS
jgi:hypothetical protein